MRPRVREARRRFLLGGAALALGAPRSSIAAEAVRRRLGYIGLDEVGGWSEVLLPTLRELRRSGFTLGENLEFVPRYAGGDFSRLAALARELVASKVDAILTPGTVSVRAVREVTHSVPIVTTVADPVGAGFAKSLGAPGSNVTGLSTGQREMYVKIISMLRELVPGLRSTFVIMPPDYAALKATGYLVEESARAAGLEFRFIQASTPAEYEAAMRARPGEPVRAGMAVASDSTTRKQLADIALRQRVALALLAAGEDGRDWAEQGGLLCHVTHHRYMAQRLANCLARILKGEPAGEIPFEVPDESWTWINRRTAAALGLRVSSQLAVAATEVIE